MKSHLKPVESQVARSVGIMNTGITDPEVRKKKLNAEHLGQSLGGTLCYFHSNLVWGRLRTYYNVVCGFESLGLIEANGKPPTDR